MLTFDKNFEIELTKCSFSWCWGWCRWGCRIQSNYACASCLTWNKNIVMNTCTCIKIQYSYVIWKKSKYVISIHYIFSWKKSKWSHLIWHILKNLLTFIAHKFFGVCIKKRFSFSRIITYVKFSFSEKATKICAIFCLSSLLFWHLLSKFQNHVEDGANFCGLFRKLY